MKNYESESVMLFDLFEVTVQPELNKPKNLVNGKVHNLANKKGKDDCCDTNKKNGKSSSKPAPRPASNYKDDYSKVVVPIPDQGVDCCFTFGTSSVFKILPSDINPSDYLTSDQVVELTGFKGDNASSDNEEAKKKEDTNVPLIADENEEELGEETTDEDEEMGQETSKNSEAEEKAPEDKGVDHVVINPYDGVIKVTLETIRLFMQSKYKFFTKEKSRMEYDPKSNFIIGTISVGKLGCTVAEEKDVYSSVESFKNSRFSVGYIPSTDGNLYRVEKSEIGLFFGLMGENNMFSAEEDIKNQFMFSLPKIPLQILVSALQIFRERATDNNDEAMLRVLFDRNSGTYELSDVNQETTYCSVNFTLDGTENYLRPDVNRQLPKLLVLNIHSHPLFSGKFSLTDDMNDEVTGLYCVIGRIFDEKPQICIRASCSGVFTYIDLKDIFKEG